MKRRFHTELFVSIKNPISLFIHSSYTLSLFVHHLTRVLQKAPHNQQNHYSYRKCRNNTNTLQIIHRTFRKQQRYRQQNQ